MLAGLRLGDRPGGERQSRGGEGHPPHSQHLARPAQVAPTHRRRLRLTTWTRSSPHSSPTLRPSWSPCPALAWTSPGSFLVTAGDNPGRLRSERSFARLCGVAPVPVSSGRTDRHRLHRGGDRDANSALWRIALVRMHCHQPTKDYVVRRTAEGKPSPRSCDVSNAMSLGKRIRCSHATDLQESESGR